MNEHKHEPTKAESTVPEPHLLLTPAQHEHVYEHSYRFTDAAPMRYQLMCLLDWYSDLAADWGSVGTVIVEPEGDACDTGNWLSIAVHGDLWVIELSPWPLTLGGSIPDETQDYIIGEGWVRTSRGFDPQPIRSSTDIEIEPDYFVPLLRRTVDRTEIEKAQFLREIIDLVALVFHTTSDRWFVMPRVVSPLHSRLNRVPRENQDEGDDWVPDVFRILPLGWIERAVWPSGTEAAFIACSLGHHQFHEPPCFDS